MSLIDVLIITALEMEFDAARDAAKAAPGEGFGVAEWEERDTTTSTPYLLGRYVATSEFSMNVALARPTKMGSTATSPVAAGLVERLRPRCLAMCGVCAGNPGDVALGDVIIAEMVYTYDEGKQKQDSFEGDHRQYPMLDTWVRAAQDLVPDGLPSYGAASTEEARRWLLERLYAGENPRLHPARSRYFQGNRWAQTVRSLERKDLVCREGLQLVLTDSGRSCVEEKLFYNVKGPRKLPFQIKVGPIASGNVVVKDGITWEKLKNWGVRSVLGLEMEAATIGSTAHRLGVPAWVVAKGVMDYADPRKDDRYKSFVARASAEVLFKFLSNQIPTLTSPPPPSPILPTRPSPQPPLSLPAHGQSGSHNLLRYSDESVEFVGRSQELSELNDFLTHRPDLPIDFAWWLWTAPGGQGKSRLALRVCVEMQRHGWRCGFLPSTSGFDRWEEWVVDEPTLVVIDHIAHRAKAVREAICSISRQQTDHIRSPLRLLLLERPFKQDDGWVQTFFREAFTDGVEELYRYSFVPARAHNSGAWPDFVRRLGTLADDDLWRIIQAVLDKAGTPLPDRQTTLEMLTKIDPLRRPLFAILAAEAIADAGADKMRRWNSDDVVGFILRREFNLWKETLRLTNTTAEPERRRDFEAHLNLLLFATLTGRHKADVLLKTLKEHSVQTPDRIYPDWLRVMTGYSFENTDDIVPPLEPDVLGELFVLERFSGRFGVDANRSIPQAQTQRLLDVALAEYPNETIQFITHCVDDFPAHQALVRLAEIAIPEGDQANYGLYVDYSVVMGQIADRLSRVRRWELAVKFYTRLIAQTQSISAPSSLVGDRDSRLAANFFNRALAKFRLGEVESAKEDCDEALNIAERLFPRSPSIDYHSVNIRNSALRLRAEILISMGDSSEAFANLGRILSDPDVSEYDRAEALLIRARFYGDQEERGNAINDCEEVVKMPSPLLSEQRSLAVDSLFPLLLDESVHLFTAGKYQLALKRLNRALELSNDHIERRSKALVNRSNVHLQLGDLTAAIEDCGVVLNAKDAPADQRVKALINRSVAYNNLKQPGLAAHDVEQALATVSVETRDWAIALLSRAHIRYGQGQKADAIEDLLTLTSWHDLDDALRHHVEALLNRWLRGQT